MALLSFLGGLRTASWVLNLLIQSIALLLLGWVLTRAVRRMAPPLRSGILLTLIVLLVLLPLGVLVLGSGQVSLFKLPVAPAARDLTGGSGGAGPSAAANGLTGPAGTENGQTSRAGRPDMSTGTGRTLDLKSISPTLMILNIAGSIWLLGFLFSFSRLAYGAAFLAGFRSSLIAIPEAEFSRIAEAVRAVFPRDVLPPVFASPAVDSPVAFGILHPVIVLPQSLAGRLGAGELASILIHETAHIRHLDQMTGLLQRIMTSLYWWNPLARVLSSAFSVAREDVSDNYAIRNVGARSYADCLVNLARKTNLITRLPAAVGMATRHISLEDRIRNIVSKERIMATTIKRSFVVLLGLAAVLVAFLVVRYSWTLTPAGGQETTFALPSGVEPFALAVDKDRIYLCEYRKLDQESASRIAIYSASDFSVLAAVGKVGTGPGEFRAFGPGRFNLVDGQIWAEGLGKTVVFSRGGVFQKEILIPRDFFAFIFPLLPVKDLLVSLAGDRSDVISGQARVFGRLYDANLQLIKQFYGEIPVQVPPPPPPPPAALGRKVEAEAGPVVKTEYQAIPDCIDFAVADDKIFVADTRRGFHISVFDPQGDPLYEIDRSYAAIPVPQAYKEALKTKLDTTQGWLNQAADVKFRDVFPAFYSFKIADGRIYVATCAQKDGLHELVVMDLAGKVLRTSFSFPLGPSYDSLYENFNVARDKYAISDNKLYYIAKSTTDGSYEVRIQELK